MNRSNEAEVVIARLANLLEIYQQENGSYPDGIDSFNVYRNRIILGMLPYAEIGYSLVGESYELYYYDFPLGPYSVYEGVTNTWSYAE